MKILLQDRTSELYVGSSDWWTNQPDDALAFKEVGRAVDYILEHHMDSVRILVEPETGEAQRILSDIELDLQSWPVCL